MPRQNDIDIRLSQAVSHTLTKLISELNLGLSKDMGYRGSPEVRRVTRDQIIQLFALHTKELIAEKDCTSHVHKEHFTLRCLNKDKSFFAMYAFSRVPFFEQKC